MKIRLVIAFLGLAISFTVPSFAQQKGTVDPQIEQQIRALAQKYDEAINKHNPAAVAALYTQDAVRVTALNDGTFEPFTVAKPSKKRMRNTILGVGRSPTISPRLIG